MSGRSTALHTGVCIALGPALCGNRSPAEALTELSRSPLPFAPVAQPDTCAAVASAAPSGNAHGTTRSPTFDSHNSFLFCSFVESTQVRFAPLSDETIRLYLASGEWRYCIFELIFL